MNFIKSFAIAALMLNAIVVCLDAQAPAMKPMAPPVGVTADAKEIVVPADLSRDYQIIELKHQLALSQFNRKVAEYLATPEMLDLRANVLGLQSGLNSKQIAMAEAVKIKPEDYVKYRYVADEAGAGKFVLIQP